VYGSGDDYNGYDDDMDSWDDDDNFDRHHDNHLDGDDAVQPLGLCSTDICIYGI